MLPYLVLKASRPDPGVSNTFTKSGPFMCFRIHQQSSAARPLPTVAPHREDCHLAGTVDGSSAGRHGIQDLQTHNTTTGNNSHFSRAATKNIAHLPGGLTFLRLNRPALNFSNSWSRVELIASCCDNIGANYNTYGLTSARSYTHHLPWEFPRPTREGERREQVLHTRSPITWVSPFVASRSFCRMWCHRDPRQGLGGLQQRGASSCVPQKAYRWTYKRVARFVAQDASALEGNQVAAPSRRTLR